MTRSILLPGLLLAVFSGYSQVNPDALKVFGGGSMGKKAVVKKIDNVAIAQSTLIFKTATTREFLKNERSAFGGRKSGGGSVAGRVTAYLETTDGDLTTQDFQDLADHFYTYLNQQLKAGGFPAVEWDKIKETEFYKSRDKDEEDDEKEKDDKQRKGQIYQVVNSNSGNTLLNYDPTKNMNIGFAFGRAMKAGAFAKELDATTLYMHTVVDFADISLDGDVKTGTSHSYGADGMTKITKTKNFSFNSEVGANVKVAGGTTWDGKAVGGRVLLYSQKMGTDNVQFVGDISSGTRFATEVSQDPERKVLNKKENIFAKDFNAVPVVIVTTRDAYKTAARKALENYADSFVALLKSEQK